MTADVELLPCPFCGEEMLREFNGALFVHPDPDSSECPIRFQEGYTDEDATAWNRRANVAHATAAKDAEIEALHSPVILSDWQKLEARAERLAEALRFYADTNNWIGRFVTDPTTPAEEDGGDNARAALRDHDQEPTNG